MSDSSFYNLNIRLAIHRFTREYAAFADLVEATDNKKSYAVTYFRGLHNGLVRDFGLDDDSTPADVILAVYANCRANGCAATDRKLYAHPYPSLDWFSYDLTR